MPNRSPAGSSPIAASLRIWAASAACAALLTPRTARAWYFPEHAELTRLGLRDFAAHEVSARIIRVTTDAAKAGLRVCPEAITPLHAAPLSGPRACVPYGALAALAGDHANFSDDFSENLRTILVEPIRRLTPAPNAPLAILLTEAAQNTWIDFQESAPAEAVRIWTEQVSRMAPSGSLVSSHLPINPRDFVRKLDADLYVIDSGYVSRAKNAKTHFHDPTSSVDVVLSQTALGFADNALSQTIAHHARSLQLAFMSRGQIDAARKADLRVRALLEHAFALHFIEDSFAAGHIATDPAVASGERRAQRHDHFNRVGLAVTRSLTRRRCDEYPSPSPARTMVLPPCWEAHGDGFASAEDRWYVGEAVARVQTAFAVALDGVSESWLASQETSAVCAQWMKGNAQSRVRPNESCDIAWMAMSLDPHPEWLDPETETGDAETNQAWARRIVTNFTAALDKLGEQPLLAPTNAGSAQAQPGIMTAAVLGAPLSPSDDPCSTATWQAHLWCPLLAAWPEARTTVESLEGSDSFGRGFRLQVLASGALSDSSPFRDRGSLGAAVGIGAGIAFMTQNVFADRGARALLEINGGIGEGVALTNGTHEFPTFVVAEVRSPITTLAIYGLGALWRSRAPLSLLGDGLSVGIFGARAYWTLNAGRPLINAWDVEVVNVLLKRSSSIGAGPTGFLDTEGRLRVGARSPSLTTRLPDLFSDAEVLVSFEVNGGYFF